MSTTSFAGQESGVSWRDYDVAAFTQAQREDRLILLDLVAVWCHWCHVMEETTYQDPAVVQLLNQHYVAIKADHDARPDLAERYRDYGWPATIILSSDGTEIVKRSGYIRPQAMARLLGAVIADPSPERQAFVPAIEVVDRTSISAELRTSLRSRHSDTHDEKLGGLDIPQKFLDEGAVRWDMHLAAQGDSAAEQRARRTLDSALALLDPAFGGAYQYSTGGDWEHPHYEKIMQTQARYLRVYAAAYAQFADPRYLAGAESVASYLQNFLSAPDGGFYTSQDADLRQGQKAHGYFKLGRSARLAQGLPRVDKHRYAGENGMAIEGLVELYRVSGQKTYLSRAIRALKWTLAERRDGDGFRHGAADVAGPYLGDNLYMGRAFLALYEISKDPAWLDQAQRAAGFIRKHFWNLDGGLLSAADNGTPLPPSLQLDQNLSAAEFLISLAGHSGAPEHRRWAAHVLRYLVTPEIALSRVSEAGVLLIDSAYRDLTGSQTQIKVSRND